MFHLAGFSSSIAQNSLLQVNAMADQALNVYNNGIAVPEELPIIFMIYGIGASMNRAQLQSPSLRRVFLEEISPLEASAAAPSVADVFYLGENGIVLDPNEILTAFAQQGSAGAAVETVLIWMCDAPPTEINATEIHTLRFTASGTAVANAWTNMAITFDQTLPAGRYQCLGARLRSTNMIAYRFVVRGYPWRPGLPGLVNVGDTLLPNDFRRGKLGVWFEFTNLVQPTLDVLCNGTDSSFTGEMDVVYLG